MLICTRGRANNEGVVSMKSDFEKCLADYNKLPMVDDDHLRQTDINSLVSMARHEVDLVEEGEVWEGSPAQLRKIMKFVIKWLPHSTLDGGTFTYTVSEQMFKTLPSKIVKDWE